MEFSEIYPNKKPQGGAEEDSRLQSNDDNRFVLSFAEWVTIYGRNAQDLLESTFIDEKGIRRHTNSWMKFTEVDEQKKLLNTGCINVSVQVPSAGKANSAPIAGIYTVNFLTNFRSLWIYFENDSMDEVAVYTSLFKLYVNLFCHKRTVQLMIFLWMYILAMGIVVDEVYPAYTPISRFINYFSITLELAVYIAMVVLFRGAVFPDEIGHQTEASAADSDAAAKDHSAPRQRQKFPAVGCYYYLKEALWKSSREFASLYLRRRGVALASMDADRRVSFYEALNIALKFISKSGGTVNINTKRHKLKLLFIFFGVPLYVIISTYSSPLGPISVMLYLCHVVGQDSLICKNLWAFFAWSLGFTLVLVVKSIFIATVLLGMVGLSFGAEVGRALVDSWISRYGAMRILDADGNATSSSSVDSVRNGKARQKSSSQTVSVKNALHPAAAVAAGGAKAGRCADLEKGAVSLSEALVYVKRDSYESYLFIREYMSTASAAWSPMILTFAFLAVFFTLLFLVGGLQNVAIITPLMWAYYTVWVAIRIYLLIVFPVSSLAHANAYAYALQEQFLVAGPEDFAVIGGRDSWLEYLDKVPALWTVYGIAVSWDRLSGLLWTGVAGIGALGISGVISSLSG